MSKEMIILNIVQLEIQMEILKQNVREILILDLVEEVFPFLENSTAGSVQFTVNWETKSFIWGRTVTIEVKRV